jgi:serine/threonine-protein kinase
MTPPDPLQDLVSRERIAKPDAVTDGSSDVAETMVTPTVAQPLPETPPPLFTAGHFRAIALHAEGGLGKVYRADDLELHRPVALKQLKERRADDPECQRRFLREAEVTARLQHPGIVPVYGLTHDDRGRPCYTMRFIEGQSLQQAIKEFHGRPPPSTGPKQPGGSTASYSDGSGSDGVEAQSNANYDSLEFRQLIQQLIAVCNTIAYAHSRGVLHRDLKPANVMLGKFGEALVVDWGLAKLFDRTEMERATGEETLPQWWSDDAEKTAAGHAVGTPAFMSPEQAAGNWDAVGPAADVFSLGAILYQLLVGKPPYRGRTSFALDQALRWDFPKPRRTAPGAPAALEAICLKAMAKAPADRYRSPKELANDLERWLADEPVDVWPEPCTTRMWRWGRRHRATSAALAAAVVLAAIGAAVFGWNADRHRREIAKEQEETNRAYQVAIDASFKVGSLADLKNLSGMNRRGLERILSVADSTFQDLLRKGRQAEDVRAGLSKVLSSLAEVSLELGDVARSEERARQAVKLSEELLAGSKDDEAHLAALTLAYERLGAARMDAGHSKEALEFHRKALAIRQKLAEQAPDHPERLARVADSHDRIGAISWQRLESDSWVQAARASLAIRRQLAQSPNATAATRLHLAEALYNTLESPGTNDAEVCEEIQRIAEDAIQSDPSQVKAKNLLATVLIQKGKMALDRNEEGQAINCFRRGREIMDDLLRHDPENCRWLQGQLFAANHLANVASDPKEIADRVKRLESFFPLLSRFSATYPTNVLFKQWLAATQAVVAMQYVHLADLDDTQRRRHLLNALGLLDRSVSLLQELIELDPERGSWASSMKQRQDWRASTLRKLGGSRDAGNLQ